MSCATLYGSVEHFISCFYGSLEPKHSGGLDLDPSKNFTCCCHQGSAEDPSHLVAVTEDGVIAAGARSPGLFSASLCYSTFDSISMGPVCDISQVGNHSVVYCGRGGVSFAQISTQGGVSHHRVTNQLARRAVRVSSNSYAVAAQHSIDLYDARNQKCVLSSPTNSELYQARRVRDRTFSDLCFIPRTRCVTACGPWGCGLIDWRTPGSMLTLSSKPASAITLSTGGRLIAACADSSGGLLFDPTRNRPLLRFPQEKLSKFDPFSSPTFLRESSYGTLLLAGGILAHIGFFNDKFVTRILSETIQFVSDSHGDRTFCGVISCAEGQSYSGQQAKSLQFVI